MSYKIIIDQWEDCAKMAGPNCPFAFCWPRQWLFYKCFAWTGKQNWTRTGI